MAKYDEQFKISIVREYLDTQLGHKALAKKHALAPAMVRRWIKWFEVYGEDAFQKKFSHYSSEFKHSVLQYMWDNELSYGQIAVHFDIRHPGAVSQWESSYRTGGIEALQPRPRGRPKSMSAPKAKHENGSDSNGRSHDDLLAELEHLRMENAYLKKLQALVQARPQQAPQKKRK